MRQSPRTRRAILFLLCWVGVYVGIFSLAKTKLPSYVTPCYPAGMALLTARFLTAWTERHTAVAAWWPRLAILCLMLVGIVGTIAIPVATHQFLPGEQWLAVVGLIPLAGGILALTALKHDQRRQSLVCFAATAVASTLALFAVLAVRMNQHGKASRWWPPHSRLAERPFAVGVYGCLEPSWIYYSHLTVFELTDYKEDLERVGYGEWPKPWGPKPRLQLEEFLERGPDHLVVTTARKLHESPDIRSRAGLEVLASGPYFLRDERLGAHPPSPRGQTRTGAGRR